MFPLYKFRVVIGPRWEKGGFARKGGPFSSEESGAGGKGIHGTGCRAEDRLEFAEVAEGKKGGRKRRAREGKSAVSLEGSLKKNNHGDTEPPNEEGVQRSSRFDGENSAHSRKPRKKGVRAACGGGRERVYLRRILKRGKELMRCLRREGGKWIITTSPTEKNTAGLRGKQENATSFGGPLDHWGFSKEQLSPVTARFTQRKGGRKHKGPSRRGLVWLREKVLLMSGKT